MQYHVGNKFSHQRVRPCAGVEERHIQNDDVRLDIPGDVLPFGKNLLIIPAKAVEGERRHKVVLFKDGEQFFIFRPFKVLAALLSGKDVLGRGAVTLQSVCLPRQILIAARNAAITITCHTFHLRFYLSIAEGAKKEKQRSAKSTLFADMQESGKYLLISLAFISKIW